MVREQLSQIDREVPLSQVTTLSRALDATVAAPRMRANLLGLFAALAMILAAIGVYGVVAYMVGQRTQEIGVRRALGAKAADVVMMLLREAMRPVALGMVIGIAGAVAMTRLLSAMLFESLGHRCDDLRSRVFGAGGGGVALHRSFPPDARSASIRSRPVRGQ